MKSDDRDGQAKWSYRSFYIHHMRDYGDLWRVEAQFGSGQFSTCTINFENILYSILTYTLYKVNLYPWLTKYQSMKKYILCLTKYHAVSGNINSSSRSYPRH